MRKNIVSARLAYFLSGFVLFAATIAGYGQEATPWSQNTSPLPAPTGFVNDYAGVIDAATKQQLETKIKNFKETTNPSVELAVAVVKTTGDRVIFDYSLAVARGWKIGSKLDNNPSALLLVAIDDRKYFTQVSKDLEGDLPDGAVGNLQRQFLVPEFKKGNYGKGISDTIDAYITTIRNKGDISSISAPNKPVSAPSSIIPLPTLPIPNVCCCGLIILIILIVIVSRSRGGGGGGGISSVLPWVGGAMIGNALSGGSSGGWGGSSGDSGGSSGGGWGGFGGGGDFGGGGAGGDW
jgi:uncharacterized protein